jgi:hypothetical protein
MTSKRKTQGSELDDSDDYNVKSWFFPENANHNIWYLQFLISDHEINFQNSDFKILFSQVETI